MPKKVALILVNYKDYAKKYSADCLASLRKQDYTGEIKIFIVDNETSEESYNYLKQVAPEAEIIRNKNNDGFAKGNNDAMKIALERGFEYIILFNFDTVVAADCVKKMVEMAEGGNSIGAVQAPSASSGRAYIGAVQARLMLYDKDNPVLTPPYPAGGVINSLGNVTHFLGFGYAGGYGEKYAPPCRAEEICYPSGAAVLFKAEVLKKIGLFDEEFWMYNEDQDLGWRVWLSGASCVLAPDAVVYHKYEFSRSIKKYYFMDRNRVVAILKNYRLATLILILPALILMEIGLIFFSFKNGWFYEKMKVYSYFLNLNNWRRIIAERKKIQSSRTVGDRRIVKMFSGKIWYQEIGGGARLKVANIIFNIYWELIRSLIWW